MRHASLRSLPHPQPWPLAVGELYASLFSATSLKNDLGNGGFEIGARRQSPHAWGGGLRYQFTGIPPLGSQIGVGAAVLRAITPVLGFADLSATVRWDVPCSLTTAKAHFVMRPQRV